MRGNLIYLTVGDYLRDVPGVLKGISIGGFERSSWEIAKKLNGNPLGEYNNRNKLLKREDKIAQLPHVLQVSGFSFTPIHNFVPQKGSKFIGYDPADDIIPKALTNDQIAAQEQAILDSVLSPDQFL
jgi:hypothetical protein